MIRVRIWAHVAAVLAMLVLAACAASVRPEREPAALSKPATPRANDALNALAWIGTSEEYRLIALQTYRSATLKLDQALMDTDWDALPPSDRDGSAKGLPPAIILDVDETVLDNSMHQARLIRDERGFDSNRWAAWVREGRADAIPGAAEFILHASDRGVAVYFVTNRSVELVDATMTNLRRVGIPVAGAEFVLGRGTPVSGCDEGSEKHCRRRLVGRRHRVLLQIGDQLSDLVSVTGNTRQARQTSVEPFAAWMGERWFLLPNPIYGSWESALFDHDWTLDEPTRRRRKLDALND